MARVTIVPFIHACTALGRMTVQGLHVVARYVKTRLTNAIGKEDIIDRLYAFGLVGSPTVHENEQWKGLS